jgi:hypothetical protein
MYQNIFCDDMTLLWAPRILKAFLCDWLPYLANTLPCRDRSGQHFGTLSTLSVGEKKRPFTAVAVEPCEFAVISRVGYNRIMKKQLKVRDEQEGLNILCRNLLYIFITFLSE